MGASAVPVLIVVMLTLTFEALLFGGDMVERSFPTFAEPPTSGECDSFFGETGCAISNFVQVIINFFRTVWGAVSFAFGLITFNVPGAPWYVRLPVGFAIGSSLVWSIATLIRGNSGGAI